MSHPTIAFTVYGRPMPRGSTRAYMVQNLGRPIVTDTNAKSMRPWLQAVKLAAVEQVELGLASRLDGAVYVDITFYMPCPKSAPKRSIPKPAKTPDIDKLARTVLDAITGVLIADDKQVTTLVAQKRYAGREEDRSSTGFERAEIEVMEDRPIVARKVEKEAS